MRRSRPFRGGRRPRAIHRGEGIRPPARKQSSGCFQVHTCDTLLLRISNSRRLLKRARREGLLRPPLSGCPSRDLWSHGNRPISPRQASGTALSFLRRCLEGVTISETERKKINSNDIPTATTLSPKACTAYCTAEVAFIAWDRVFMIGRTTNRDVRDRRLRREARSSLLGSSDYILAHDKRSRP